MNKSMPLIDHVVVAIMENRSFDNLLGWLYSDVDNCPPHTIPPEAGFQYDGLVANTYANTLTGDEASRVYVKRSTSAWPPHHEPLLVPMPDPGESFAHITRQIFGTDDPPPDAHANMSGFLRDYATVADSGAVGQIMETYSPDQAPILNGLARNFAVCDRWFASAPCQTWPNRGFVHCGSSAGHINNDDYVPYDIPTIFNVLYDQGISWGVFSDTIYTPALTGIQFSRLWSFTEQFKSFAEFQQRCRVSADAAAEEKLPAYSFIEPRFLLEWTLGKTHYANDYHCSHNIAFGEAFLAKLYGAVQQSPYRDRILLIISFDEHGGCYDHVPPPCHATPPEPGALSNEGDFHFDRFGVRVPAIVVSSYVEPGTVFRAEEGEAPYDHTSILATLRDWKELDQDPAHPFLPSSRIAAAPTLARVLTRSEANHEWPTLTHSHRVKTDKGILKRPLNDLETSLLVGEENRRRGDQPVDHASIDYIRNTVKTHQHLVSYRLQRDAPQRNLIAKVAEFWLQLRLNVVAPIVQWCADRIDTLRH
ncbi:MAG TPA: alkaline phosphatase family protein [Caldilineaceae bacterium]|nr:alkaline phosphatase family protein [Caldilineaceae bacterium]